MRAKRLLSTLHPSVHLWLRVRKFPLSQKKSKLGNINWPR